MGSVSPDFIGQLPLLLTLIHFITAMVRCMGGRQCSKGWYGTHNDEIPHEKKTIRQDYLCEILKCKHYSDVITSAMTTKITGVTIVCSTVFSNKKSIKAPRHWPLWGFPSQRASTRKKLPFDNIIMKGGIAWQNKLWHYPVDVKWIKHYNIQHYWST